jgi:predicted transcriptional regulator
MRSQMKIIVDILVALENSENGAKITDLVRKANVPYVRLTELLDELLKKKLIESIKNDDGNYYRITKNGAMLLDEYRKFSSFAENLGLEID